MSEYLRAGEELTRDYGDLELSPLLALVGHHADMVDAPALDESVSRDPEDDKFLACALAAGVEIVISGDDDLLSVDRWRGIEVLSPRAFVDAHLT